MPGIVAGSPTTPYTQTGQPGRWQGGRWIPAAGTINDVDQMRYLKGEADNATGANQSFAGTYTDSQGRVNHVNSPYKENPTTAFNRSMDQFGQFMGRFGGGAPGGGSGSLSMQAGGGQQPRVALDTAAIDAGDRAAFSRAKDRVGSSMQGLLKSIGNQFATRGLRGSSLEGRALGSALESGAGQLADVEREQAIEGSRRAEDLAKTAYGGEITQRGQDLDAASRARALELTAQGQQQGLQQSRLASILGLFNAFKGQRY